MTLLLRCTREDIRLLRVRQVAFQAGMGEGVARWCAECVPCAMKKPGPGRRRNPMQHVNTGSPLERIAIYIVGPLPRMENGNEYIMVMIDYFTKWAEAYALPYHTAQTVADKLLNEFVCRFAVPQRIHTDQGREFESHLFARICEVLETEKTRTTPYRPQSDELVERFNKALQQMLSIFVNENSSDWDDYIPLLLMAYTCSQQQSIQCPQTLLTLGREATLPLEMTGGMPRGEGRMECPSQYVEWVKNSLQNTYDFARENLKSSLCSIADDIFVWLCFKFRIMIKTFVVV